ncbi:MAG: 50S ribosomal protein L11 methyltransferase [Bdellovibrionales bacterium]|nr:50S ribosomal protein L11 methyltransferase [Bdellovibrionales bacterium]
MNESIQLSPQIFLGQAPGHPGRLIFNQVPSHAFGDGSHPTTRLCAGIVDFICRTSRPEKVLDVGTGTGVLARIARARGAREVVATDIDPEALRAAFENSSLDAGLVPIEISDQAPNHWGPRFDLVIANILEGPLRELARSLHESVRPGGRLLISGFTRAQIPGLTLAFCIVGFSPEPQKAELNDWAALVFRKDPS